MWLPSRRSRRGLALNSRRVTSVTPLPRWYNSWYNRRKLGRLAPVALLVALPWIAGAGAYAQLVSVTAITAPEFDGFERRPGGPFTLTTTPSDRPVIAAGGRGEPITAFDPFVMKDHEGYHAFFTSLFCRRADDYFYAWDPANPAACDITNTITGTAYGYSTDRGLTWRFRERPAVYPSADGWDSASVETPYVVRVDDTLFLFYSGESRELDSRFQIGLATLELIDGSVTATLLTGRKEFLKRPDPFIPFEAAERSLLNNVQEPSVLPGEERFVVYFIGLELERPDQPIGAPGQRILAIALSRRVTTPGGVVLTQQDQILKDVNIPEVVRVGDFLYLFSTTIEDGEFHRGETIEYRISRNGVEWKLPPPPFSGPAPFENWGLFGPTAVVEGDSLVMFYTALGVEDHPCFPVPPGGRLGRPIEDGSRCVYSSIGRGEGGW